MKTIVIALISSAALAVASPTAAAQTRRCTPTQPSFASLTATPTVSCGEARAMNTYMTSHETLSGAFTLRGETWSGTVYARRRGRTYMVYRHGAQAIWITYRGAAS